jgi:PAS domain S-box-containing protein
MNRVPPPVVLEEARANTFSLERNGQTSVRPGNGTLDFRFTALSLSAPEKQRFRYRLEPYDREWVDAGTQRTAHYTNMAPGEYAFRVIAANSFGVWNEQGASVSFVLQPHYYQTKWFYALCAAPFPGLLWAAYRFRIRQLQREFKRLRDMIETIPAMAWTARPDGSNAFVNKRWAEYTGLSAEETAGSGWTAAVHPEDRQQYSEEWRASLATGEPFEFEVRFRCAANGEYRWLLARGVPLRDEHGIVTTWYGLLTDIDDRKRAEQALRRSEAYLAETQRLTHTGTFAADRTTAPLYWSDELCRLFGFDPQDGIPTRDQPLQRIHPEDLDKFEQAWDRLIREKADTDVEYRIVLPDGTVRHVFGLAHPVLNANREIVEVVGTTVDITERKRAEKERERLRELEADLAHINRVSMMGELTASIAHEVNQPLSGIVSNGSACLRWLARDPPNVEEVREAVGDIVRDGKRAGEVIARIRALTKRTAPPQERLDLNETIREVLALVGDEARRNSVMIRTHCESDLSPVSGDRVQLQQVVLNLMMNAIEALSTVRDRPRELAIVTRNIDADQVQVSVEDSGPGLDQTAASKIFDPFYTTKAAGMGMGLSITRSILQNHGGRLWATANQGPGASFHFTLPKYRGEEWNAGAAAV